jgi:hypothetical protein
MWGQRKAGKLGGWKARKRGSKKARKKGSSKVIGESRKKEAGFSGLDSGCWGHKSEERGAESEK